MIGIRYGLGIALSLLILRLYSNDGSFVTVTFPKNIRDSLISNEQRGVAICYGSCAIKLLQTESNNTNEALLMA